MEITHIAWFSGCMLGGTVLGLVVLLLLVHAIDFITAAKMEMGIFGLLMAVAVLGPIIGVIGGGVFAFRHPELAAGSGRWFLLLAIPPALPTALLCFDTWRRKRSLREVMEFANWLDAAFKLMPPVLILGLVICGLILLR